MLTLSLPLTLLLALSLALLHPALGAQTKTGSGQSYEYQIGAKDLLEISVFEVPELNITVRVSENGMVTLPLLGEIKAEGLNRADLEKQIAASLEKNYLKNAQVTIFIKEFQSKKISVMGAVKNPGEHDLIGRQSLLQVISMAGGLSEQASATVIIFRQFKNAPGQSLVIRLDELLLKANPKYNITVFPGDIINVPGSQFLDIYVFGQVKSPGAVRMKKGSDDVTLLRAIAQVGGFSDRARSGKVMVTRTVDGVEKKINVDVKDILRGKSKDFVLQAFDVIFVPESIL
ncbi:MAG: polysaccharide biosynthesis/export family protein [Candidatus Aminicenantes bacterium]|nr:polysaccharide biosynthesis/export family protein [Candidatus Aminicenantes bacterium]